MTYFKKLILVLGCVLALGCAMSSQEEKIASKPPVEAPTPEVTAQINSDESVVIVAPRQELVFLTTEDILEIKIVDGKKRFGLKHGSVLIDLSQDSVYAGYIEFTKEELIPRALVISKLDHWTQEYAMRVAQTHDGKITALKQADNNLDFKAQQYGTGTPALLTHVIADQPAFEVKFKADRWTASYDAIRMTGLIPGRTPEPGEKEQIEESLGISFDNLAVALFGPTLFLEQVQTAISEQIKKGDVSDIQPQDIAYIRTYISIQTEK